MSPWTPALLGEGASRELGGGVGGAFHASGRAEGILTPDDFSLVPPGGTISLFPTARGAAGAPFYFIDSGRPTQGLPASDAALAARPRWAVAASPPQRDGGADRPRLEGGFPRPAPVARNIQRLEALL